MHLHSLQKFITPKALWSKATLITGGVGGAGAGEPTFDLRTFFYVHDAN